MAGEAPKTLGWEAVITSTDILLGEREASSIVEVAVGGEPAIDHTMLQDGDLTGWAISWVGGVPLAAVGERVVVMLDEDLCQWAGKRRGWVVDRRLGLLCIRGSDGTE